MSERYRADADKMSQRKQLSERVGSELSRNEQETGISFFGDADRAQITTYSPTIVRSILCHAYAKIEWVYTTRPEGANKRVHDLSRLAHSKDRREIEGVQATLPLGTLTIKGNPRQHDRHSEIVTTPEEIEGLAEVFGRE